MGKKKAKKVKKSNGAYEIRDYTQIPSKIVGECQTFPDTVALMEKLQKENPVNKYRMIRMR